MNRTCGLPFARRALSTTELIPQKTPGRDRTGIGCLEGGCTIHYTTRATTLIGFEPMWAKPNRFRDDLLNHSDTMSATMVGFEPHIVNTLGRSRTDISCLGGGYTCHYTTRATIMIGFEPTRAEPNRIPSDPLKPLGHIISDNGRI